MAGKITQHKILYRDNTEVLIPHAPPKVHILMETKHQCTLDKIEPTTENTMDVIFETLKFHGTDPHVLDISFEDWIDLVIDFEQVEPTVPLS